MYIYVCVCIYKNTRRYSHARDDEDERHEWMNEINWLLDLDDNYRQKSYWDNDNYYYDNYYYWNTEYT